MKKVEFIRAKLNEGLEAKEIVKLGFMGKKIYRSEIDSAGKRKSKNILMPVSPPEIDTKSDRSTQQKGLSTAEARERVQDILEEIKNARNSKDLEDIESSLPYHLELSKYPKILFGLTKADISTLRKDARISGTNEIAMPGNDADPMVKLLYSLAWKRGDLQKIKHIIEGVSFEPNTEDDKEDGLVFYQFGKYLADKVNEPIVDQHTIRGFKLLQAVNATDEQFNSIRKLQTINKKHITDIVAYKEWLRVNLNDTVRAEPDHVYLIDRILFGLGKWMKLKAKSE